MTLNCEMSRNATAYAQKLADMDSLVPSGYNERPEQGENLSLGCYDNREQSAEEAVKVGMCHYFCKFRVLRVQSSPVFGHPLNTDPSLLWTACGYIFSILKPLNTGTPLIRTFFTAPSVNVLSRFDCIYF